MANNLSTDITDRFVLLRPDWFKTDAMSEDPREHVFLAEGGFGCSAYTMGNAVVGEFAVDGEQTRVEGFHLQNRFATWDEVNTALGERRNRGIKTTREVDAAFLALSTEESER